MCVNNSTIKVIFVKNWFFIYTYFSVIPFGGTGARWPRLADVCFGEV